MIHKTALIPCLHLSPRQIIGTLPICSQEAWGRPASLGSSHDMESFKRWLIRWQQKSAVAARSCKIETIRKIPTPGIFCIQEAQDQMSFDAYEN